MQTVSFPARKSRALYRHELRNLAYVTLDEANGGIVRNLSPQGVGIQAVAPLREKQRIRVRFELRHPRLQIDSPGEVAWADSSGECGIRFLGLSAHAGREIKEWIFGNLLDSIFRDAAQDRPLLRAAGQSAREDGLIFSTRPRPVIPLDPPRAWHADPSLPHPAAEAVPEQNFVPASYAELDWLSRPLSARALATLIDSLVILAALLIFTVIFLAMANELPSWQLTAAGLIASAALVAIAYWILCSLFGGATLGVRLAQIAGAEPRDEGKYENEIRLR